MKISLTRRNFLKKSFKFFAFPPISLLAKDFKVAETFIHNKKYSPYIQNGVVNTAAHWGGIRVVVQDGKIMNSSNVFPNQMNNPLHSTVKELVYAKDRVRYPMVRKSFLENPDDPKPELRGSDSWIRVSWEEGLKLAAQQIKKVRKEKGPLGIYGGSHGWKSVGALHNAEILLQRFMRSTGGCTLYKGDYSTGASQVIMPYVTGSLEVHDKQTSWETVIDDSDVVVFWGANPLSTAKISYGASDSLSLEYYKKLKCLEKRIICIDPVFNETCEFFNLKQNDWVTPFPNTDVALIIGMCHTLYVEKRHNQRFLDEYTEGFEQFKEYFLGKKDGIVKDVRWASKITGIDVIKIKELVRLFSNNRTFLMAGWSLQRQQHGEQRHWAIVTLAAMLGQIGLSGGGFSLTYHTDNAGVPQATGGKISSISSRSRYEKESIKTLTIPVARISDMLLNPNKTIHSNGKKIKYPNIDLIYWAGGNPFCHQQDTNKLYQGWNRVNTVIVNEIYWTSTARMADIVFPSTTTYERNDIDQAGDYSGKYIYPMKAVVPPQYEAKSDYWIFSNLVKYFGEECERIFTEGKQEMDWISEFYESAKKNSKALKINIPPFRTFWKENKPIVFSTSETEKKYIRFEDFRDDPLLNALGTESGMIEIFSERVHSYKYDDCPGHPTWIEPVEWVGKEKKDAEFAMVSPHSGYRLHSQQNNTSLRNIYEISGLEPIWINSDDAKNKNIKNGDIVRVFNKRGQTLAGAFVTNRILSGTVRLCEGAWYDPVNRLEEKSLCKHGAVNVLTLDMPSSKLANANCANTVLVNIEKYKGKVPPLSIFKQPQTI